MVLFRDPVSGLQFFGYSIALGGLLYYRLGADKLKEIASEGTRQWADYGNRSPIVRKLLAIGLVIVTAIILIAGISSMFPQYVSQGYGAIGRQFGDH